MDELAGGVRRLTFPLPLGIDHVHCYLVRGDDGAWLLVDTGLGVADAQARWRALLAPLEGGLAAVVITHFHPDHVGGAADVAEVTGGAVFQGALDYEQCVRVWGDDASARRVDEYLVAHGMPREDVRRLRRDSNRVAGAVHFAPEPERLEPGEWLGGWEVVHLPGHADGHLGLLRDGVLIAGDAILGHITPTVGLYPDARPDPLADYLGSLERVIELAPRIAFAGHGAPIADPVGRARELIAHHRERLGRAAAALRPEPRDAYTVSLALFPGELPVSERRFALAESLAHLERLVREGGARRVEDGGRTLYASP